MRNRVNIFKHLLSYATLLLLFLFSFSISAANKLPSPTNLIYLNDYVGVMQEKDIKTILSIGRELQNKTGAQATVVIMNSTEGVPIETYANDLFRTWGIGQKEKDNGLLILLAIEDHAWRVEVGRGLEGPIPDLLSHEIMTTLARPSFQKGNYSEGIVAAYNAFSSAIAKEYNITLEHTSNVNLPNTSASTSKSRQLFIIGPLLVLLFLDLIFNRGRVFSFFLQMLFWSQLGRRNGRGGGNGFGGGGGGFGGGSSNGGGSSGGW